MSKKQPITDENVDDYVNEIVKNNTKPMNVTIQSLSISDTTPPDNLKLLAGVSTNLHDILIILHNNIGRDRFLVDRQYVTKSEIEWDTENTIIRIKGTFSFVINPNDPGSIFSTLCFNEGKNNVPYTFYNRNDIDAIH